VPAGAAFDAFISYSHAADGRLASQVQTGLQRLAKPPLRPRALRVFRDETGLTASPELWPDIQRAVDASRFFILMASPDAAKSVWVGREIDHWLTASPAAREGNAARRLLIVLTDGDIAWDEAAHAFHPVQSTALPERLHHGVFGKEPLWVDLREARTRDDLSLRNPYFRGKIADLAAPIHGKSKDDLIGEDVRLARRTRRVAWTAAVMLGVLAVTAAFMAYTASVQRDQARSREAAARAAAMLEVDPRRSLELAIDAVGIKRTAEAVAALREALVRSTVRAELVPDSGRIIAGAFSPDGRRVLTRIRLEEGREYLQLWDAASGQPGCRIPAAGPAGFTADGERVVTADGRRRDARTCLPFPGDTLRVRFPGPRLRVMGQWWDNERGVRDARTGALLVSLPEGADPIRGAARSADGGWLVSWAEKGAYSEGGGGSTEIGEKFARVWPLQPTVRSAVLSGHRRAVNDATFGRDLTIVTGSDDRTVRLWSVQGEELAVLRGHRAGVERVGMSSDGSRVLSVAADGRARLWEPGTRQTELFDPADLFRMRYGAPLPRLAGRDTLRGVPARTRDRRRLVARVGAMRLAVWDSAGRFLRAVDLGPLVSYPSAGMTEDLEARLSPDGAQLLVPLGDRRTAAGDPATLVVDLATGQAVDSLRGGPGTDYTAAYTPDGTRIATAGENGRVRLWNAASRTLERVLEVGDTRILHVAFSPDGARLVTSSRDAIVRVWDLATGAATELFGHEGGVLHAFFSPDGALVVSIAEDDGVRVWDAAAGRMLGRYYGYAGDPAFLTPDCGTLVVAGLEAAPEWRFVHAHAHPFGACGAVDRMLALARRRT
jgi:WD40 repeat protein